MVPGAAGIVMRAWKILRGASLASTVKVTVGGGACAARTAFFCAASGEISRSEGSKYANHRERIRDIQTSGDKSKPETIPNGVRTGRGGQVDAIAIALTARAQIFDRPNLPKESSFPKPAKTLAFTRPVLQPTADL